MDVAALFTYDNLAIGGAFLCRNVDVSSNLDAVLRFELVEKLLPRSVLATTWSRIIECLRMGRRVSM